MEHNFNNEVILSWLSYFAEHANLDLATLKILDITRKNKNLLPTVQTNRQVMVFTDAGHPEIFYDMWDAGLGDCDIWYNEGSDPAGPIKNDKLQDMIDRGINAPAAMLIINNNYRSTAKIGMDNWNFSSGSIRYVSSEIRAVIMSKLQVELRDTIVTVGAASIAVEAAMIAGEGTIYAVEHSERDKQTMEENVQKFGLKNVVVGSSVESALDGAVPALAFLVASRHMAEEIEYLLKINPDIRIIIYTLSFEHLTEIPYLFKEQGMTLTEMVKLSVHRLSSKKTLDAEPAPWLLTGQRR